MKHTNKYLLSILAKDFLLSVADFFTEHEDLINSAMLAGNQKSEDKLMFLMIEHRTTSQSEFPLLRQVCRLLLSDESLRSKHYPESMEYYFEKGLISEQLLLDFEESFYRDK